MAHKLTLITYNCQCANDLKLPFFIELVQDCDFLLIQEHGLSKSQLNWFDKIGTDISSHCVCAMDERVMLTGRPYGGCAILWKNDLNINVEPIGSDSSRLVAVVVELDNKERLLLVCVYMPCDDRRLLGNLKEYESLLNDMEELIESVDVDYVCIGGDWNTDHNRDTHQTKSFLEFLTRCSLGLCSVDPICTIDSTFCSKSSGAKSFIDHFCVTDNLLLALHLYDIFDGVNNKSDHVAVKCTVHIKIVQHQEKDAGNDQNYTVNWKFATAQDIDIFSQIVDEKLNGLDVSCEVLQCTDFSCQNVTHREEIEKFHNSFINILIAAGDASVKATNLKKCKSKAIPGWNEYVESHFREALFWHKLWVENGRPIEGVLFEIRQSTRLQYHKIRKNVLKKEKEVKCDRMANALVCKNVNAFWNEVKKFNKIAKNTYAGSVDGVQGKERIANVLCDKFESLYSSVGYDVSAMMELEKRIESDISAKCSCSECDHASHNISEGEVLSAISRLKFSKRDDVSGIMSDHIIHAKNVVSKHLALMFTAMIIHGYSPEALCRSTIIPIPKGRWANLGNSNNYRAITLGSMVGKVLEFVLLNREQHHLLTCELQFGFKEGMSTTQCTSLVVETVSYFNHEGSNVYGLMLDASKAFDRVNFVKLFTILLDKRGVCPMICRLLLNIYRNQKLRLKWNGVYSDYFIASNGVKQGGVISPCLFCVYIDQLLIDLKEKGIGCFLGSKYVGAIAYADDLTLLSPSVSALKEMVDLCSEFAQQFDLQFNSSKSQLIGFSCSNKEVKDPGIMLNGHKIEMVDEVIHLGHRLSKKIYDFNVQTNKCIGDFNRQCNIFLANFKYANSYIRNLLFHRYCSSFYGFQLCSIFENNFDRMCTQWRVAIRRVWKIPWQTHNRLLPHIAGVMPPQLWFVKRMISFVKNALNSTNATVAYIVGMSQFGAHSVLGGNIRLLQTQFDMSIASVLKEWNRVCREEEEMKRIAEQIKEIVFIKERGSFGPEKLNKEECNDILYFLCMQ